MMGVSFTLPSMWDSMIFPFYFKAKIKLIIKLVINQQVASSCEWLGEDHLEKGGTKLAPHSLPHLVPHGNPLAPNLPLIHGPMTRAKPRAKPEPGPHLAQAQPAPAAAAVAWCGCGCCRVVARLRLCLATAGRGCHHGAPARLAPSIRMLGALRC